MLGTKNNAQKYIQGIMFIPENVFVFGLFSVDGEELFESVIGILVQLIEYLNPLICAYFCPETSKTYISIDFWIKKQNTQYHCNVSCIFN